MCKILIKCNEAYEAHNFVRNSEKIQFHEKPQKLGGETVEVNFKSL
jgi:hypothetical protein